MWAFDSAQHEAKGEDRVLVSAVGTHAHLLAVFDGHGSDRVAKYCEEHLRDTLPGASMRTAAARLKEAFAFLARTTDDICFSGSTATIALVWNSGLIAVGTLGDSLWVAKNKKRGNLLFGPAHNIGSNELERASALQRGGSEFFYDGRAYLCRGSYGLQLTRALGDAHMLPAISREPEIRVGKFGATSKWFALMSDGVLDTLSTNYEQDIRDFERMMDEGRPAKEIVDAFYPRKRDDTSLIACHWVEPR